MTKYPHVEDYLELLAGYDPASNNTNVIFGHVTPNKIRLARYDVQIVENMAGNTVWGTALTDRQADLAVKLILKYRRQFTNIGIDVTPVETPVYRLPVRKIDRTRSMTLDTDGIKIRFPYDQKLIEQIRQYRETAHGRVEWNNQTRVWTMGITEGNVNWAVTWAEMHQFSVDDAILDMFESVIRVENQPYEIKLIRQGTEYIVTNAEPSLTAWIDQHLGQNLIKLIDHAGLLGYAVDEALLAEATQLWGSALEYFGPKHRVHLNPGAMAPDGQRDLWQWLLDYAELTDRYPICVYDPNSTDLSLDRFDDKQVVHFDQNGKTKTSNYNPYDVKIIYARKLPQVWEFPVPMMITTVEMMYGGRRADWLNRAEKIVYWTNTIINVENF